MTPRDRDAECDRIMRALVRDFEMAKDRVAAARMAEAANPHQLAYIDGATRCTACGKLGVDISITGQTVCAGSPSDAEPPGATETDDRHFWNTLRDFAND